MAKKTPKKKDVGRLLNIYLRENQVLIKKVTTYRTTYFMYRHIVNAYSDVVAAGVVGLPNIGNHGDATTTAMNLGTSNGIAQIRTTIVRPHHPTSYAGY